MIPFAFRGEKESYLRLVGERKGRGEFFLPKIFKEGRG